MIGAMFAVLGIGFGLGLLGRLVLPGRFGVTRLEWSDLAHDDELHWEVGGAVIGALGGYVIGRAFDGATIGPPSALRWTLCLIGATVLTMIAVASGVIDRAQLARDEVDATPKTRQELYELAKQRGVPGRSKMRRAELAQALGQQ